MHPAPSVAPGALAGRVALVTGGSRGIGRAISTAFVRAGASVAVNYRRDVASADTTVRELSAIGPGRVSAYSASMERSEEIDAMVASVQRDLGPIDIVVNNAGTASRGNPVAHTDPAELPRLMAVNAFGPHRLAQLVLPDMRSRGRGDIVMVSSTATRVMGANGAPYNMAKAAMEALAFTLAAEEETHGVRVNVVAPGLVATDMGERMTHALYGVTQITQLDASSPFGRVCRPEDVAEVVTLLVGLSGGYVTGQRIAVDGGAERNNRLAKSSDDVVTARPSPTDTDETR